MDVQIRNLGAFRELCLNHGPGTVATAVQQRLSRHWLGLAPKTCDEMIDVEIAVPCPDFLPGQDL